MYNIIVGLHRPMSSVYGHLMVAARIPEYSSSNFTFPVVYRDIVNDLIPNLA